jgi:hypothetical protein
VLSVCSISNVRKREITEKAEEAEEAGGGKEDI